MTETPTSHAPVETGYAPVNDLRMYYELHGQGGVPLLLLHGGLFDIDQQFGALLPTLSVGRRVVAADFQGHGRTNDVDRPLTGDGLTSDVVGLPVTCYCDQHDFTSALAQLRGELISIHLR